MSELVLIFFVLVIVVVLFLLWAVVGHVLWLIVVWFFRELFGKKSQPESQPEPPAWLCYQCGNSSSRRYDVCVSCHASRPSEDVQQLLTDLAATKRQLARLHSGGQLDEQTFVTLSEQLDVERVKYFQTARPEGEAAEIVTAPPPISDILSSDITPDTDVAPPVTAISPGTDETEVELASGFPGADEERWSEPSVIHVAAPRRKPLAEVLNSFMEESNIRWGEIIGGLLIIGCSTALTVSLWAEISRIPVVKFLIFTTVTAVLFGIGLYTEHRWKLPTTSRGILTISTLLVPLNFLAIAAVSATVATGGLVIASELLAPAIFLCLVYFAGRIITPGHAHLLSAGLLGSSIGQLLVRHLAGPDSGPLLLLFLGAFPVACYVISVGLALHKFISDEEIDASDTTTAFTMLGTMSFAALLPFGLLFYRAGPLYLTLMYLAPLITVWGLPMLATGTLLWRRIRDRRLVASRTTGTALGILGTMIVLAGMILAWPNPASIVPAALLNFAIFTALAVLLEIPAAHTFAALCLALAYVVLFQVFAGNVSWQNLRVASLLKFSLSASSGQALLGMFVLCLIASERLAEAKRRRDSNYYLASACLIALASLVLLTVFGLWSTEQHAIWLAFTIYALGAFWIAWRRTLTVFAWIGSSLLLFALGQAFSQSMGMAFPWQTALFVHASMCVSAAVLLSRFQIGAAIWRPLNASALISSSLALLCLLQANPWQVTAMQAERVFWLAGIWLIALWLNRAQLLFICFQITLTFALMLTVKASLQDYEWYAYLPNAFLHPWALQIQGTTLALLVLVATAVRHAVRKMTETNHVDPWIRDLWRLLNTEVSVDRIISWILVVGLLLLAFYGSASGLVRELAAGPDYAGWDLAGFPHREALGVGSWTVLGLLVIAMLANWWERRRDAFLLGAVAALSGAVPLIAGQFEMQIATATAWRWFAALFLLAGSMVIWKRVRLSLLFNENDGSISDKYTSQLHALLLTIGIGAVLPLTVYPIFRAILYLPLQQPTSGFFALFDNRLLYAVPLVVVAATLIGYAIRERSSGYAMAAGLFLNLIVTVIYLLSVVAVAGSMNRVVLARVVQFNIVALSIYGVLWLSREQQWRAFLNEAETQATTHWFNTQDHIARLLNALLIVPTMIALVSGPGLVNVGTFAVGSAIGWVALLTSIALSTWTRRHNRGKFSAIEFAWGLFLIGCLSGLSAAGWNVALWTGLHALLIAILIAVLVMLLTSLITEVPTDVSRLSHWFNEVFALDEQWTSNSRKAAICLASFAIFLALRIAVSEPSNHWWPIGGLVALSGMFLFLNWQTLKRRYIYVAGTLFNIAASLWWLRFLENRWPSYAAFLQTNIIAASLSGIGCLYLDLRAQRLRQGERTRVFDPSFHSVVGVLALIILSLLAWANFGSSYNETAHLLTVALASTAILLFGSLWDRGAKQATGGLYILGLIAGAIALEQLNLSRSTGAWALTTLLACYALATSLTWHYRTRIIAIAKRLGIPERMPAAAAKLDWLMAFNIILVGVVAVLSLWIDLTVLDWSLRASAALAVVVQLFTFVLLANAETHDRWYLASFAVFMIGTTLFGWAWLTPGASGKWLNRSVILVFTCFTFTGLYSLELIRMRVSWPEANRAIRNGLPWVVGAGLVALFFCLATEIFYRVSFGAVNVSSPALITIGLVLLAAVVTCVLFALSPEHDPLNLTAPTRMVYVYVAELMLGLLFLHVRLTMPWLFTGFFERYWPMVVMAVAYAGVVTSEALRRRKLLVLSQPIERTGTFLPLLPVMGFWFAHSDVDYSSLLFVVGGLYGLLSILRRSFVWGLLAALAGNGGLWYWLHRTNDYQFLQHPQLWLVPVAVSVLLAAYLNEDNLTDDQMISLRYLSLVAIYVSSTADIFINGVANSPWLPLILAAFSLAGVFSGFIFRIRGLLLLGAVFLLLAIITMIWYASANLGWTWLWYVAGIATGATIIFMFAVFEKKRGEVLRMVEGLKEWEP